MAELALPSLSIKINADGTLAINEVNRVKKGIGGLVSEVQAQAEKIGSGWSKYITTPIAAMYTAATKGAADLVETVGKTEVVFGQFYDRVDKWSQSSIETMGVARSTALDMASLYGDMATGMGFGQEAAADMAMELSSLAADMASFKNISIDMAQTALKSVFTGETESLKNLGVVMTQANLQAYALSQGITKNITSMTQAEQVTLRYNYVLAQTTNAQGDFARTGDSLSNQSRKLGQTVKQLGETFGTLLIPKVTEIVSWLQGAAQGLAELDDGTKNTILTIGAVVAAAGPMLLTLSKTLKLITALKAAMAASTFGPAALAIMGAVGAAGLLVAAFNRTKKEIDTTSESYQKMKKLLDDNLQTTVEVDGSQLENLEDKTITVTAVAEGDTEKVQAFIDKVEELGWEPKTFTATGEFEVSETTIDSLNEYATALAAAASATGDYKEAVEAANAILDQQTQAKIDEANNQLSERMREQTKLYNSGIISWDEYIANLKTEATGAEGKIRELEEALDAAQQSNMGLADGIRNNDFEIVGEAYTTIFGDEKIGAEDLKNAAAAMAEAAKAGEDMTGYQLEAKVTMEGLKNTTVDSYNQMIAAKQAYDDAMSSADATEQEADAAQRRADVAGKMSEAVLALSRTLPVTGDTEAAIDAVAESITATEEEAAALKEQLEQLVTGDDGQLMGSWEALEMLDEHAAEYSAALENERANALANAEALRAEAQTAREEATQSFGDSMEQIQQNVNLTDEELQGLLSTIAATGVEIDPATVELISGVQSMVTEVATTLKDGGPEVADGVSEMIGAVGNAKSDAEAQGRPVGAAITAGITSGLNSGTGTLYSTVRRIVANAIKTAKAEAKIASPSKRMRDEVGRMLIRGMDVGAKLEMPSLLSGMKENMNKIISGAQAVVNRGSYTVPAVDSVGRWGGIDYQKMGDALAGAVQDTPVALVVNDKAIARATSEATGRAQAIRAQRINAGKGRW